MKLKWILHQAHKFSALLYLVCIMPQVAFADDTSVTSVLNNLEELLTGSWGKIICTLAIAGVGYACFVLGRLPIKRAMAVAVGAACIMGAATVLQEVTGG